MAKRKMEYEIVGKSDVEQVTNRAKASINQLEQFTSSLGKKLSEFGKDFALGFLSPMLLLHKAIDYIARKQEEARQRVKDARDFMVSDESKGKGDPLIRQFLIKSEEMKKAKETEEKIAVGKHAAIQEFLETSPEGQAIVKRINDEIKKVAPLMNASPKIMAADPKVQEEVMGIMRAKLKTEPEAVGFAAAQGGNVIGVGQSALDIAVGEQTEIQKEIRDMLRAHLPQQGIAPDPDLTNKPEPTPTYRQGRSMRIRMPGAR